MIRRPPRSTQSRSSAASDVYKRQPLHRAVRGDEGDAFPHAALRAEPADVQRLGTQAERTAAGRLRPEQQVRQLLGTGADEAGHAEDLPGADLERQVLNPRV